MDPLVRMVELVAMDLWDLLVLVDLQDTLDQWYVQININSIYLLFLVSCLQCISIHCLIHLRVLLDLPVCLDLPAHQVVDMMSLDTMSTEPISLL